MMVSFILSLIFGYFVIPILRKKKLDQVLNRFLEEKHKKKSGTPTMGGIIFIIPTLVLITLLLLFGKIDLNYSLIIVLFTFISYSLIGFIDDYLIIKKHNNNGLSESTKFLLNYFLLLIYESR